MAGMAIGGAVFMRLGNYLLPDTGWWLMFSAMIAGTFAGGWVWLAAYAWLSGWTAFRLDSPHLPGTAKISLLTKG